MCGIIGFCGNEEAVPILLEGLEKLEYRGYDSAGVAVLSDELVMKFKNHPPVIPLAERMEILANVKGVNEVVAIEDDPSRLLEHSRRPFDCFFSGDDYAGNEYWKWEKEELRKLGADIVFFPYTKEQSSTMIRRKSKTPADS